MRRVIFSFLYPLIHHTQTDQDGYPPLQLELIDVNHRYVFFDADKTTVNYLNATYSYKAHVHIV